MALTVTACWMISGRRLYRYQKVSARPAVVGEVEVPVPVLEAAHRVADLAVALAMVFGRNVLCHPCRRRSGGAGSSAMAVRPAGNPWCSCRPLHLRQALLRTGTFSIRQGGCSAADTWPWRTSRSAAARRSAPRLAFRLRVEALEARHGLAEASPRWRGSRQRSRGPMLAVSRSRSMVAWCCTR